jgi:hypothetical protein
MVALMHGYSGRITTETMKKAPITVMRPNCPCFLEITAVNLPAEVPDVNLGAGRSLNLTSLPYQFQQTLKLPKQHFLYMPMANIIQAGTTVQKPFTR